MDWMTLSAGMASDRDMPPRCARVSALNRVLDGTLYDHLAHAFSEEKQPGQGYIRLQQRRPSARSNLCRTVVDDTVSLLFGEGHFPPVMAKDKATVDAVAAIVKAIHLSDTMAEAAVRGSVGSVAILVRVLGGKPYVSSMTTENLTPIWNPRAPDRLLRVVERYKVTGAVLAAQGYARVEERRDYWFQRTWDESSETWYLPTPVLVLRNEKPAAPKVDKERSVTHGLGRVPIVWATNLPGGDTTDGACTFEAAISTVIELDYLMSQAGRALRIAGDPLLLLKTEPSVDEDGKPRDIIGGASDMLVVPPHGDAKLLEINGDSARASLEHCRMLRHMALEAAHGNRADADKLTAAQSGRALEMMNQGLVWVADKLRVSYGERALLDVLRILIEASNHLTGGLVVDGVTYRSLSAEGLALSWPDFYPPTPQERLSDAQTLAALRNAGLVSRRTAVRSIAPEYDIEDVDAELVSIAADETEADARAALQPGIQVKAIENLPA